MLFWTRNQQEQIRVAKTNNLRKQCWWSERTGKKENDMTAKYKAMDRIRDHLKADKCC